MTAGDARVYVGKHDQREAMVCNGADDYAEVDAFTVAQVAANDTLGTFTAWVNLDDYEDGDYVIFSSGDANVVEYISFGIQEGAIIAKCVVATVTQWEVMSEDDTLTGNGGWHHIAVVQNGTRPIFYHNGEAVEMTDTTATDLTAWYDQLTGGDVGAIGLLNMNATQTLDTKGGISDVKYFDTDLTATKIVAEYNGNGITSATTSSGSPTNLIAHWVPASTGYSDDINDYEATYTNTAYYDSQYSELTKQASLMYGAATDFYSLSFADGQFALLHVLGA